MNSFYKGLVRDLNASMKDFKMRKEGELTRNALGDAIQQAREFEEVLRMMKRRPLSGNYNF